MDYWCNDNNSGKLMHYGNNILTTTVILTYLSNAKELTSWCCKGEMLRLSASCSCYVCNFCYPTSMLLARELWLRMNTEKEGKFRVVLVQTTPLIFSKILRRLGWRMSECYLEKRFVTFPSALSKDYQTTSNFFTT